MFGNKELKKRVEHLEGLMAISQGKVTGLQIVLSCAIDRLEPSEREGLIDLLRHAVGRGYKGNPRWLEPKLAEAYNNALSATLQDFIEYDKDRAGR